MALTGSKHSTKQEDDDDKQGAKLGLGQVGSGQIHGILDRSISHP